MVDTATFLRYAISVLIEGFSLLQYSSVKVHLNSRYIDLNFFMFKYGEKINLFCYDCHAEL